MQTVVTGRRYVDYFTGYVGQRYPDLFGGDVAQLLMWVRSTADGGSVLLFADECEL